MSTKLTPHFTLEELTTTKTGLSNIPDDNDINQLLILCRDILEPLRTALNDHTYQLTKLRNAIIIVDSAFRSAAVNRSVGGVSNSQHLIGQAADIHSNHVSPLNIYRIIGSLVHQGQLNIGQCIFYKKSNFVHVSLPTTTHKNEFTIRNK